MSHSKFKAGAELILEGFKSLGINIEDYNYKGTAERVAFAYEEMVWDISAIKVKLDESFSKTFPADYDEMLTVRDIKVFTLCPHHLLPCTLMVNIGYVPKNKVLGLSKFARIAEVLAKKPVLQEQYTSELVNIIQEKLDPQGVAVYVKGRHSCMEIRGIKSESVVTTSALTGCFKDEAECRKEFYDVCRTKDV